MCANEEFSIPSGAEGHHRPDCGLTVQAQIVIIGSRSRHFCGLDSFVYDKISRKPDWRHYVMTTREDQLYAVVRTGGRHYRVAVGDSIDVEKIDADEGESIGLDEVIMLSSEDGVHIGQPTVEGASVTATVDSHFRGPKIRVFKFKRKKRYRRTMGHRQSLTRLTIDAIDTK